MPDYPKYSAIDPDEILHRLWVVTPAPEWGGVCCRLVVVLKDGKHGLPTSCHCLFPRSSVAQHWIQSMGLTWRDPHPDADATIIGSGI